MTSEEKDQVYLEFIDYLQETDGDPTKENHDELKAIAWKLCQGMLN